MSLNIKYWRAIFFTKLKTLIHKLICVKTIYPATIKNDNGAVAMRKSFVWRERKQQIHQFLKDDIG